MHIMNILHFKRGLLFFIIMCLCTSSHTSYGQVIPHTPLYPNDSTRISLMSLGDDYRSTLPGYIPASPTASSLAIFSDYPVSYYTGVPDISIPLYEVNIDGYKLPISLNYHASGVRVNQEASWVGLGWALNAGGVISRTVKCYDDFLEYTYPGKSLRAGYYDGPEANNPTVNDYFTTIYDGTVARKELITDSEPDIFSYSLPGLSGKFLIDKSRGAVLLNKADNIKVEVLTSGRKKYFKLTAPDGTQYILDKYETTYSYGRPGSLNRNLNNATKFDESDLNLYDSPVQYTSSWYLSQIKTVNNRTITFTYENESYKGVTQESCVAYNVLSSSGYSSCGPGASIVFSCNKTVIDNLRLSKISWDGGYIDFGCTSRDDMIGTLSSLNPQKLSTLKVYDKANTCIKNYQFDYDYFNNNYTGSYKQVFKRLKLTKLSEVSDTNNNHVFSYYEGQMPAKNSKNTDYWGYYNGSQQKDNYYCTASYGGKTYRGADKSSQLNYMQTGSLRAIKYPTGASSIFTYETNKYAASSSPGSSTNIIFETVSIGLNVYKYHTDDFYSYLPEYKSETIVIDKSTPVTIFGSAESMSCVPDPDIFYGDSGFLTFTLSKKTSYGDKNVIFEYNVPSELNGSSCSADFPRKTITLQPGTYILEAFALAKDMWLSFAVQYEKETHITTPGGPSEIEISGGGLRISKIETGNKTRKFEYSPGKLLIDPMVSYLASYSCITGTAHYDQTIYLTQTSESSIPMYTLKNGNAIGYDWVTESVSTSTGTAKKEYRFHNERETSEYDYPFFPTQIDYYNGLPISIEYYRGSQSEQLVKYDYSSVYSQEVYGFMFNSGDSEIYPYNYRMEYPYISKETIVDYNDNGNIYTEKEYDYNAFLQKTRETTISSGDHYRRQMTYPSDLNDAISNKMVAKHLINIPIEVVSLKNGSVTMGKKIEYKDTLNLLVPGKEYTIETKQPLSASNYKNSFVAQLSYDHYNSLGKPMQVSDKSTSIVYLWSYNNIHPVAEIKNCTYEQVKNILGVSFINTLSGKSAPTASDMSTINNLRSSLPDTHISTYTYSPLVGVTSATDARGLTTYYTYDSVGRLTECYILKNGSKQILEHYDYHFYNK